MNASNLFEKTLTYFVDHYEEILLEIEIGLKIFEIVMIIIGILVYIAFIACCCNYSFTSILYFIHIHRL